MALNKLMLFVLSFCLLFVQLIKAEVTEDKGLEYLGDINWPSMTPPTSTGYDYGSKYITATNNIKGNTGFVLAIRDPLPSKQHTYWFTREWVGVVQDTNPGNTSALKQIINFDKPGPAPDSSEKRTPAGADIDTVNRYLYFCTTAGRDVWRINLDDISQVKKIHDRENPAFIGCIYESTQGLVWAIAEQRLIWVAVYPGAPEQTSINPNPPSDPASTAGEQADPANGKVYPTSGTLPFKILSIFKDHKTRSPKTTPYIYLGGQAFVYRTEALNTAWRSGGFRNTDLEAKAVGAGKYTTGAINPTLDCLYLGSDLGLAVQIDLNLFKLTKIFFAPGEVFLSVLLDGKALFWGTDIGSIYRVNTDTFQIYAKIDAPRPLLKAVVHDQNTGLLYFGTDSGGSQSTEFRTYTIQKTDCSVYDCHQCYTQDTAYCGICTNTGFCTTDKDCAEDWEQIGVCPEIYGVSPSSANVDGGTLITIVGSYFKTEKINQTHFASECIFKDGAVETKVQPTEVQNTQIVCKVPPKIQLQETGKVTVGVRWKIRDWGLPLNFTYYNCSAMDCPTCFGGLYPECGWCLNKLTCSSSSLCPTPNIFSTTGCPAIKSIVPPTASIDGGENIVVTVSNLIPSGYSYKCKFGDTVTAQPATYSPSGTLTCVAPDNVNTNGEDIVPLTIQLTTGEVFTPISADFIYYDCNKLERCTICKKSSHPKCVWCGNPDLFCTFATGANAQSCTGNGGSPVLGCPVIDDIQPASSDYVKPYPALYSGNFITYVGRYYENYAVRQCVWVNAEKGYTATTTATCSNPCNSFSCITPTPRLAPNYEPLEFQVHIAGAGKVAGTPKQQTEPVSFLFYDCTAPSCHSCLDKRKTNCRWCNSDVKCGEGVSQTFSCSSGSPFTSITQCPTLTTVTPNGDSLAGGNEITLTGNFKGFVAGQELIECEFEITPGTLYKQTDAIVESSSLIRCTVPEVDSEIVSQLHVKKNGSIYTNDLPFRHYDCSTLSTCEVCLNSSYTGCVWCGLSCKSESNCSAESSVVRVSGNSYQDCPRLVESVPAHAIIDGGDKIQIKGGPFIPEGQTGVYTCQFDGVVTTEGARLQKDTVQCITPRKVKGTSSVAILYNGVHYTKDTVSVEFFECQPVPVGTTKCAGTCTNQPFCGWCVETRECGSEAKCDFLWLPECLNVDMEQAYSNLVGNETIKINIQPPLPLTVGNDDVKCVFDPVTLGTPANITYDGQFNRTIVECTTLPYDAIGPVTFNLHYLGSPLFEDVSNFLYVDCEQVKPDCGDCTNKAYSQCGWCLSENKCSTESFCPSKLWAPQDCPALLTISPAFGEIESETPVTITGRWFVDADFTHLTFGNSEVGFSTNVNGTTIIAKTPKISSPQSVKVKLTHNNGIYSVTQLDFQFVRTSVDAVGVGVGTSAGLLVLAGAGVVGFLFYRRRFGGSIRVQLKEPDYVEVAYGSDMILRYRMPDDNYGKLEKTLNRMDFGLQLAMASFCPPTEQDAVAKSLVHCAYGIDPENAIHLINANVKVEVFSCIQENTIFRGNSLVSKMFKFYSRMVGIKYLWRGMARVIAELEILGAKEIKEKEKMASGSNSKKEGTSLLSMSMELDSNKMDDMDIDVDTNILQLQLTCQKLFSVIVKNSLKEFPLEFRKIFVIIDQTVMQKFGSDNAAYKAIGGFFFLRFVCPSITAPHVYGLLTSPPNQLTQRQLVLISKVLQSLANMQVPGKKEKYMEALTGFIEGGIPKVVKFYEDIRKEVNLSEGVPTTIPMPKEVKQNALATTWNFIFLNQEKLKNAFKAEGFATQELQDALEEMVYDYKTAPKKAVVKGKGKKGKAAAKPAGDD